MLQTTSDPVENIEKEGPPLKGKISTRSTIRAGDSHGGGGIII
jgi:hypothetical protein